MKTTSTWLLGTLMAAALCACSIDPNANKLRGKNCGDAGSFMGFCLANEGGSANVDAASGKDSGGKDGGGSGTDAAADGGGRVDAGSDAGPVISDPCEDEGDTEVCYDGKVGTELQPPCHVGRRTCRDGQWSKCEGQVVPKKESCNGKDDNCNGQLDEKLPVMECADVAGKEGICKHGIAVCQGGNYDKCIQIVFPESETCDEGQLDQDCDGSADEDDEDLFIPCYDGVSGCTESNGDFSCTGVCKASVLRCLDGEQQTVCMDTTVPGTEIETLTGTTATDEDCDGKTDEGINCVSGTMLHCYSGAAGTENVGECHGDDLTCAGNVYGVCDETTPKPETCVNDLQDDDCNGETDDVPGVGQQCTAGAPAQGLCSTNGRLTCDGAPGATPICLAAASQTEMCNGLDDDCNGAVDNGFNFQTDKNNCGRCGLRCSGSGAACCAGLCVNLNTSNSHCGSCGNACGSCGCNGSGACNKPALGLVCL